MPADIKKDYIVVGLMSGTSLDGVDIALCRFSYTQKKWLFSIISAQTVPYKNNWKKKLVDAETSTGLDLLILHKEYGTYLGQLTNSFLKSQSLKPDLVSSHGHTIFHQPEKRITFQLGDGSCIAAETGITTISDFRNLDIALGGQGAPLVPVGDELLFGNYDQCLNLGGFANISFNEEGKRRAFDICPVNIVLNYVTNKYFGKDYDKNGLIGSNGNIHINLLKKLNELPFFSEKAPKSLGKEWVLKNMLPLVKEYEISACDKLRTLYENIAVQLSLNINAFRGEKVLITGGGAYNNFLIELLQSRIKKQLILPDESIIDFKEALIFAFLGVLRYLKLPNCLASVTGAKHDNSGGTIFTIN